jgi:hypothetical protein
MSEDGANIDLLFRNGLKDFEVLPPHDVWDGIKKSGKVKSKPFPLMKVAAAVTVLLSLGFLTYKLNQDVFTGSPSDSAIASSGNVQEKPPVVSNQVTRKFIPQGQLFKNPASSEVLIPEARTETITTTEPDATNLSEILTKPVHHFSQNLNLSLNEIIPEGKQFGEPANNPEKKSINTNYSDYQHLPAEIVTKPENRWSIAALASPTYYSKFNTGNNELSNQLMQSEEPVISYSGGVGLAYKINRRFSVQSGLYYSSLGQKLDGINSFGGFKPYNNSKGANNFEILTSTGTIIANNPDVFLNANASERIVTAFTNDVFDPQKANLQYLNNSLTQNLSYIELPVMVRYKLIDKTIGVNLIGGMSYNFLVQNSVFTEIDGNKYQIGDTHGLNPLSLSSSLGMGMEYNFSKKLSLNFEPTFRYYLNPFTVTTGSYVHTYSFGIFSGVSYKF